MHVEVRLWITSVLLKKIEETFSGLSLEYHNFQGCYFKIQIEFVMNITVKETMYHYLR